MTDERYGADPTGGELSDVARRGAREWQRDMALWEGDAETLRLRQRSVVNVLWEAMQRGDVVTCTVGDHTFSGRLRTARGNLAILVSKDLTVAVNVDAVEGFHLESGSRGVVGDRTYGSMKAYLGMLEVEGTPVRILGRDVDVRGRVLVAAEDHVLLAGLAGGEWAVKYGAVAAVIDGSDGD